MKNVLSLVSLSMIVFMLITMFEPVVTQAVQDTIVVSLTVDSGISITSPPDVTMSNIGTGIDNATGAAVWNVKSNDPDGYTLDVKASTAPAMVSGSNSFADYTETPAADPQTWTVDSGTSQFGFSGFGVDVVKVNADQYNASGQTACDNGSAAVVNPTLGYLGFETTDQRLATRVGTTSIAGVDTTICFAAGQNAAYAPSGLYTATITATALVI